MRVIILLYRSPFQLPPALSLLVVSLNLTSFLISPRFAISSSASYLCITCAGYLCISIQSFFHLPSNFEADVDYGLLIFRLQTDPTVDLKSCEQNAQQHVCLPLVKFSAPVILVEKQLGFGISVQIKEELNRLRD